MNLRRNDLRSLRRVTRSWSSVVLLVVPLSVVAVGGAVTVATPAAASSSCPYQVVLGHADGAVTVLGPSGDACANAFHGSMDGASLNEPIVGMASIPGGGGYWLVAADGGIFSFDAPFYGSMGGQHLNQPIVGMASTPDGKGYWLVAADGGVFAFGDARYHGSMGGSHLNQPVVGIAADGTTGGYWEVAADGGIFSFAAPFYGSMGGKQLNAPIKFVTGTPDYGGYRMVGSDGGVFNFGDAQYFGSAASAGSTGWEALTSTPDGNGYWLFSATATTPFGDAAAGLVQTSGDTSSSTIVGAATLAVGPLATFAINCPQTPIGNVTTSATLIGSLPGFLSPGAAFSVQGLELQLNVSALDSLLAFAPSAVLGGTVTGTLIASGAVPTTESVTFTLPPAKVPTPIPDPFLVDLVGSATTFTSTSAGSVTVSMGPTLQFSPTVGGYPFGTYTCSSASAPNVITSSAAT